MSDLTVLMVTRNDESTLEKSLTSLQHNKVLIGDLGSTDSTLKICKKFNTEIMSLNWKEDYSVAKNQLCDMVGGWKLLVEPWEVLSGYDVIKDAISWGDDAYMVYVIQGDSISKEIRLWRDNRRFQNPAFEKLEGEAFLIDCMLSGMPTRDNLDIIKKWKNNFPHIPQVDYYLAHGYMARNRYDDFLCSMERFLFNAETESSATLFANYYLAMVKLFVKKDVDGCIKHVVYCLVKKPTMAEFWCLLGDAFFAKGQFQRASIFYDNAIKFGSKRPNDSLPVEIKKYKEYPENMIRKIYRLQ